MNEPAQSTEAPRGVPARKPAGSKLRSYFVWTGRILIAIVLIVALAWTALGILFVDQWLPSVFTQIAMGVFLFLIALGVVAKPFRKMSMVVFAAAFLAVAVFYSLQQPSHDRIWQPSQAELPQAKFTGSIVDIDGVRTFSNDQLNEFGSFSVDLNRISSLWFGVDRFDVSPALAHTFVSFGFDVPGPRGLEQEYLTISIETRREATETTYSPLRGLFNNYELIYIVAQEADLIENWTEKSTHPIQLYPVYAEPDLIRQMFTDMMKRVNQIHERPEFYHSIKSNCTNNIVYHVNRVAPEPISMFARGVVFPGYSDWLAYEHGLIDTELTLEEAREAYRIDEKAREHRGKSNFSALIRE